MHADAAGDLGTIRPIRTSIAASTFVRAASSPGRNEGSWTRADGGSSACSTHSAAGSGSDSTSHQRGSGCGSVIGFRNDSGDRFTEELRLPGREDRAIGERGPEARNRLRQVRCRQDTGHAGDVRGSAGLDPAGSSRERRRCTSFTCSTRSRGQVRGIALRARHTLAASHPFVQIRRWCGRSRTASGGPLDCLDDPAVHAPHRQRLPASPSWISARVGEGLVARRW